MNEWIMAPAGYEDRNKILELSAKIWGGQDYINYVLDEWLGGNDPFILAWHPDRSTIVGCAHAVFMRKKAWLEGVRVAPEYEKKGIGGFLYRRMLYEIFLRKPEKIGALIHKENEESLHLARKNGFDTVVKAIFMQAKPLEILDDDTLQTPVPLFPNELGMLLRHFSEYLSATRFYIFDSWVAVPEPDFLQDRFLFDYPEGKIVAGTHLHDPEEFSVSLISTPGTWMVKAFKDLRSWAYQLGSRYITLTLPISLEHWMPFFQEQGFACGYIDEPVPRDESQLYILEYNPVYRDKRIVLNQLGLSENKADNYYATVERCGFGFPRVIECFPFQQGKPFTTTHYLTCPFLRYEISKMEEAGWIKRLEAVFASAEMERAHEVIRIKRMKRLKNMGLDKHLAPRFTEAFNRGIGGIRDPKYGKCLHLHVATYLAGFNDPAGRRIIDEIRKSFPDLDCGDMKCFKYFL